MKRIRWKKLEYGFSSPEFVAKEKVVLAVLSPISLEGMIVTKKTETVDAENIQMFKGKTLVALKKQAKIELKALGVLFDDEVRPGRNLKNAE